MSCLNNVLCEIWEHQTVGGRGQVERKVFIPFSRFCFLSLCDDISLGDGDQAGRAWLSKH